MYQNCCKKCGSVSLHTEVKGNNTGLYCDDCGAWVKWVGKDELRAFEYSMREATKKERESINKYIESISEPVFTKDDLIKIANAIKEKCGEGCCPCRIDCEVYTDKDCLKRIIDWLESIVFGNENE